MANAKRPVDTWIGIRGRSSSAPRGGCGLIATEPEVRAPPSSRVGFPVSRETSRPTRPSCPPALSALPGASDRRRPTPHLSQALPRASMISCVMPDSIELEKAARRMGLGVHQDARSTPICDAAVVRAGPVRATRSSRGFRSLLLSSAATAPQPSSGHPGDGSPEPGWSQSPGRHHPGHPRQTRIFFSRRSLRSHLIRESRTESFLPCSELLERAGRLLDRSDLDRINSCQRTTSLSSPVDLRSLC